MAVVLGWVVKKKSIKIKILESNLDETMSDKFMPGLSYRFVKSPFKCSSVDLVILICFTII